MSSVCVCVCLHVCVCACMCVSEGVTCVCRYGGILLHADRFKHINNVARTLIQDTGLGLEVLTQTHTIQ